DHFLSLCPIELTVDLLEERLAAAEKSILALGASCGDRHTPFFEGCSLSPFSPLLLLLLLSTSLALRRSGLRLLPVGGTATARARGARVVQGTAGAVAEAVEEAEGVAVEVGVIPGVGAAVEAVEAAAEVVEAAAAVVEAAAAVVEAATAVVEVAAAVVLVEVQLRSVEALVVASASSNRVPVRPHRPSSFVSGTLGVGGLGFPDAVELPRWGDMLRQNVAIFDLDFDAILAAMYAVTDSAEGDCYLSVPPNPGIEAAALGASAYAAPGTGESADPGAGESALSGSAPTEALHTFTLDSGASRSFFRDNTTVTPLNRPVTVSLADPSGGPVLAHSSTVLPCPAAPSGLLSGLHLPSFSTNLVSGADLHDTWVDQFTPGGQRVTHCSRQQHVHHCSRQQHPTIIRYHSRHSPRPHSRHCSRCDPTLRFGVASEGAAHSMPGMERNRAAPSPQEPREACRHVEFAAISGEYAVTAPMPLNPQRPPCFDPSQRGGLRVQSWVFTMNVFFDANYVESDAAKIRYAVSLLRGPAMDWWRVIVTSPCAYEPLSQEGPTGPAVTWSSFCETAQYSTWDAWCARLRARFEPIVASISALQKLRT
ncbi:unnamed protein product, partial [Closterium sp. NIES-54]